MEASAYYRFMVPRLNGGEIRKKFSSYLALVRKGIAGFIVFGGELETLRKYLALLQEDSGIPLIIASDLERGLGQQVRGGTIFPPAMAVAQAVRRPGSGRAFDIGLFRKYCRAMASEAAYAGINTIFAPVLDVNTNPRNPIIATRAFGEDTRTVALLGSAMVREFERSGIAACGKHFPGHGDTRVDSHIRLPSVAKTMRSLGRTELRPFRDAASAGASMLMLGHLKVPALDPSGVPVSLSGTAVSFIRGRMRYDGLLITDALNMGGIAGFSEEEAASRALSAGVDLVLHPSDTDRVCAYLDRQGLSVDDSRVQRFRMRLCRRGKPVRPAFERNQQLCRAITAKSLKLTGRFSVSKPVFLMIMTDDPGDRGRAFVSHLKKTLPIACVKVMRSRGDVPDIRTIPDSVFPVAAVFSETRAWKGGSGEWIRDALSRLGPRLGLAVSFGSPYLFDKLPRRIPRILAYADSEYAEEAASDLICRYAASER